MRKLLKEKIECEKCGGMAKVYFNKMYLTFPAKYDAKCGRCNYEFIVSERDLLIHENGRKGTLDTLKIKKLHPDATIPTRAHETDSGLDIYANETVTVTRSTLVSTGVAIDIPPGYEGTIRPRSGLTSKTVFRVQLGTVDAGYNGEIKVMADSYPATAIHSIGHRVKKVTKSHSLSSVQLKRHQSKW